MNRSDLTGTQIGKYRVEERIGRGGMGEVYRAHDTQLDQDVAIKRPLPAKGEDPRFDQNVLREARKTCKVKDEHVARVIEVIEHDGQMLIVMDLIEGSKLSELVRRGPIEEARLVDYALQIAGALEAIHQAGLVHRDLKPANIMITPRGRVKVLDFGLVVTDRQATVSPQDSTASESSDMFPGAGTLPYMSPEQLKHLPLDARSDLFSLGVVLYEALTGRHPFQRPSQAETSSAILNDPPGARHASLASRQRSPLGRVITRLLEKEPARRYASATDLRDDLQRLADGQRPSFVPRGLLIGALATAVLLAGFVWVSFPRERSSRAPNVPEGRPTLAILPLDNETGRGDDPTPMIRGLLEALLNGMDEIRPIEQRRVDEVHTSAREGKPLQTIARGLSASWVLGGQVYREASGLVARLDLFRAADGSRQSLVIQSESATRLARDAAQRVRGIIAGDVVETVARSPVSDSEQAQALYETARRAARELDYQRAVDLLRRAIAEDSQFVSAQVLLPEVLDAMGNQRDARTEADRAWLLVRARGFPETSRVSLLAEGVHARMRSGADHDRAARAYRDLLDRHPDDVEAIRHLAGVYGPGKLNRPDEALRLLDLALEYDGQDATLHLDRARLLVRMRRLDAADRSIARAEAILEDFGIRGGMGDVQAARGFRHYNEDREQARAAYEAALAAYEADGLELRGLSLRYVLQGIQVLGGDLAGAIAELEAIIDLARRAGHLQTLTKAQSALGSAYYKATRLDRADAALIDAIDSARDLSRIDLEHSALIARAGTLTATHRMEEARLVIERSLAIAEQLEDTRRRDHSLLKLAMWHRTRGEPDKVELALEPILSGDSVLEPSAYQALVLTRLDTGQFDEALAAADLALAGAEQTGDARSTGFSLCLRARVRAASGDVDGARADLERSGRQERLADKTPSWEKREREAWWALHAAEGNWAAALEVLRPAPGNPDHAEMLVMRARALAELGQDDEAKAALNDLRALFDTIPAYLVQGVERISALEVKHEAETDPDRSRRLDGDAGKRLPG